MLLNRNHRWQPLATVFAASSLNLLILATPLLAAVAFEPIAASTFIAVGGFLIFATLFCAGECWLTAGSRLLPQQADDRPLLRLAAINGAGLLVAFVLGVAERSFSLVSELGSAEAVGALVMLAGCFLRCWAIFTLSGRFRTEGMPPPGYQIETRGPYALIRHPSEVGLVLIVTGAAVLLRSNVLAFSLPLQLGISYQRIRIEERLLKEPLLAGFPQSKVADAA